MCDVFAMPAGAPTLNNAESVSLAGPPTGGDASEAAPALLSTQVPHSSASAAEGFALTSLSPSQPPRAQSQARAIIEAPMSPAQSLTRKATPPILIAQSSVAHVHKSSRSSRPQISVSPEGSSPKVSALMLSLSGNDVMSSFDWDMDSEDEEGRLPISHRQLDSSPEESDSEGHGSAWVSSLGYISKRKALSKLPHRAWPATAPRPRARAIGGQLTAARAPTPAPALTTLCSRLTTSLGTVRPAAALTAVASAASLTALPPAFTEPAAPIAVAPGIAAAPAISAEALAEALAAALCAAAPADALSAGRPIATAALSPAQSESAQTLQADDGQLADDVEVTAQEGAEETMPVQASEADAAQLCAIAPADALSAVGLHSASPMALGGESIHPIADTHQLADAQSAAPEEGVHSAGPLALDQESVQPTAAAEQLVDVQAAMLQSPRWAEDSCEEHWCAAEDYFSTPLPWKQPQQAKNSPEPAAAAASGEAAAPGTKEETMGSSPGAEPMQAALEGASQLGGMVFGTITAADLLAVSTHTADTSLGNSEDILGAAAAAGTAEQNLSGSQLGGMVFGTITPADLLAVSTHTADTSLGNSEDILGAAAAAGTAGHNSSGSQLGGMVFGTITSADLLAVSTHTADTSLGNSEDMLGAAAATAAGTAEQNLSGSQLGGMVFGTITSADLLAVSTHTADTSLGNSKDMLGTAAAAGTAEQNISGSQLGGMVFGTITPADLLAVSTHTADACLGDSEDVSGAAAACTAEEGVSAAQLSRNQDSGTLTDTQTAVSHGVEEDCKEDEEEEAQVNTSLGYTAFVTDSLLGRMEQKASSSGGDITALGMHCLLCLLQL